MLLNIKQLGMHKTKSQLISRIPAVYFYHHPVVVCTEASPKREAKIRIVILTAGYQSATAPSKIALGSNPTLLRLFALREFLFRGSAAQVSTAGQAGSITARCARGHSL